MPVQDRIIGIANDGTIRTWDTKAGKTIQEVEYRHTNFMDWVLFSPDRQYLAVTVNRRQEQDELEHDLILAKVADGSVVWRFSSEEKKTDFFNSYLCLAFNQNGSILASGHTRGTIRLWETQTGKLLKKLDGSPDQVTSLCFAPDGKTLAASFEDKSIRLWRWNDGKELLKLEHSKEGCAASLVFTPDGKQLVSCGGIISTPRMRKGGVGAGDKTIRVWDVATGKEARSISIPPPPQGFWSLPEIAMHPHKHLLACRVLKTVILWDLTTGKEIWKQQLVERFGQGLDFSPDGNTLAVSDHCTVRLFETTTGKVLSAMPTHQPVREASAKDR